MTQLGDRGTVAKTIWRQFLKHHRAFGNRGFKVDLPDMDADLSGYRLVIAPMLYLYRSGIAEKLKRFVENGGTLVGTYWRCCQ